MKRLIGLIIIVLFLPLAVHARMGVVGIGSGGVATAGGSACSTSEIVPTYTVTSTNWIGYPSGTVLDEINELIAGRDTNDLAYITDTSNDYLTMRFTLPGDCDVTAIRAEIYADSTAASVTLGVDISNDNSTWTSAQSVALVNATPTALPKTFSSLSWTTPAYCYVRFLATSETYSNVRIYSLSITVNP